MSNASEPDFDAYENPMPLSSDQKPMVTREQYNQARAVLDALPSGYYVKCATCGGWYVGGKFIRPVGSGPICEGCQ